VDPFRALNEYLTKATGTGVLLKPAKRLEGQLSAYLAQSYALGRGEILDEQMTIALAKPEKEGRPSFKRLRADFKVLQQSCEGGLLVLAFEHLPSYLRSHLVQARVPFLVIGRQIFLPHHWVDLRERELAAPESPPASLTWSAQVVLLRHLRWHDVEQRSLSDLAHQLHYSAMAMTLACRQLQAAELATTRRDGRSKHLSFVQQGRSLWEMALPKLRKPWSRRVAVSKASLPHSYQVWHSGISALSRSSAINSESTPVRAIGGDFLRKAEESKGLSVAEHMEFAQLKLEVWEYDPGLLARGESVDPLSLFLCLREDPNERIQGALEELLGELAW
jgi:DNA-binding MarR family transcriptional regulator